MSVLLFVALCVSAFANGFACYVIWYLRGVLRMKDEELDLVWGEYEVACGTVER